jgi:uncharacterized protein YndB with AHSA1/START domain
MTSTGTTPTATGRKEVRDDGTYVVLTRTFHAPVEHVWAAVTESDRLARWIGRWDGDPAEGHVTFRMVFEGDGHPAERMAIEECVPPHHLVLTTTSPGPDGRTESWTLRLDLAETGGVTTFTFAQSVPSPDVADSVGPGWDFYLDRMTLAEAGQDPASLDFDDYYPRLSEHYRTEFA